MASETFIPFFGGMVNQGESYCQARIGFIGTVPVMFVDEDNRAFGLHWQKQIRTAYMEDGRMAYIEEIRGKGNPSPTGRDRLPAGRCSYCLQPFPALERDHIDPTSKGGADIPDNIVPACRSCNSKKKDRTLLQFVAAGGICNAS